MTPLAGSWAGSRRTSAWYRAPTGPSRSPTSSGYGLHHIQAALDPQRNGVSAAKIVVSLVMVRSASAPSRAERCGSGAASHIAV